MAGPTIRRRQLGIELKQLREAADVSPQTAADTLKCSRARISYIEGGRNALGYAELVMLANLYGAGDKLDQLEEMREQATKRGWWSTSALPDWLAGYVGLEDGASAVRCVELEVIPGLLQTEQYARALYALRGGADPAEAARRIAARMKRQGRLTEARPLQLHAVISQAALERCARHASVANDQLQRLHERAQWPNVEVRVLPFDLGLHDGMSGPFTLLSFPDRLLDDAAYQEYAIGGHVIDKEQTVAELTKLFNKLRGQALPAQESLAMIAELLEKSSD